MITLARDCIVIPGSPDQPYTSTTFIEFFDSYCGVDKVKLMYVRQIERTELNGMVLQYTQSLPEICYNGLVLCFIAFDGDINCVFPDELY